MELNEIKWNKGEGLEELIACGIQPMQWASRFLDEGESIYEALPEHYRNELLRIFYFFEEKLEGMEKAIMRLGTSQP